MVVKSVLDNSGLLTNMFRKFKLAFSGCLMPESKPYISDLGIMVTGAKSVQVVGAGSLGTSPMPGVVLYETLPIEQVPALALAALRMFVDHGDHENRRKARFRHIRQRVGDGQFMLMLNDYFAKALAEIGEINVEVLRGKKGYHKAGTVQGIAGDILPADILLLCDVIKKTGAELRINLNQGIDVYSTSPVIFPAQLKKYLNQPIILACPGNTTCKNGIVNSPAIAAELADTLRDNQAFTNRIIAISGCPNNCMHSCVSDIGLIGRIKTIDTVRHEAYTIMIDGDNGITPKLAQKLEVVIASELADKVGKL